MSDRVFLEAIEAEPANPVPRLVYADWLDERGDPRGELLRLQEEIRHTGVSQRAAKEAWMHELLRAGVEPLTITRTNSIGLELVLIFPGEFVMGSPKSEEKRYDYEDQAEVTLTQGYWLGRYPVTQAQWQRVMGSEPWQGLPGVRDDPRCPATYVSWEDAMEFCRKFTEQERQAGRLPHEWKYSLPTEAQWEYACRAGTTTRYSFSDDDSQLGNYAWFTKNANDVNEKYAHPVGQKWPNPWGLYDTHGNVWEWCRDWYRDKLPGGTDPVATDGGSRRAFRGGGWFHSSRYCRSAFRNRDLPSDRNFILGFRVAQVPSVESAERAAGQVG